MPRASTKARIWLAERFGKNLEEPAEGRKAMLFFPNLMDLGIGARHEGFEITADLRLRGKAHDSCQTGRSPLVEIVEAFDLRKVHFLERVPVQFVEDRLQLSPISLFFIDEALQIDDHKSCLCFTFIYWETRSTHNRS